MSHYILSSVKKEVLLSISLLCSCRLMFTSGRIKSAAVYTIHTWPVDTCVIYVVHCMYKTHIYLVHCYLQLNIFTLNLKQ